MSKTIELIYSQQVTDFIPGRAYSNPRFFTSPRSGVSKVFLVGDWPNIRAAYENIGVPVERLDTTEAERKVSNIPLAPAPVTTAAEDPASVVIPADWKGLGWSKPNADGLTLRGLASSLSATPILNKEHAYACIEGELARREKAETEAPAED